MTSQDPGTHIHIAPSILACDFLNLGREVRAAEEGGADRLHIDVMDGRFVPNISIGIPIVECIRAATSMHLEAHLMIVEPDRYLAQFAQAGADTIIVHSEVCPHLYRVIEEIHELGKRAGVAINPGTPCVAIEEVLVVADLILVMTVSPGFGGQRFISGMMPKLRAIRRRLNELDASTLLEVDGGINRETAAQATAAGARVLVAGTSVYGSPSGVAVAIGELRTAGSQAVTLDVAQAG